MTRKIPKYFRQSDERKYEPKNGKESLERPILPFRSKQVATRSARSQGTVIDFRAKIGQKGYGN